MPPLSLKDAVELGKYMKDTYGIEAARHDAILGNTVELADMSAFMLENTNYVPFRVYVDTMAEPALLAAMKQVMEAFDLIVASDSEPELGSWFKSIRAWFAKPTTQSQLADIGAKAIRAAEVQGLDKPLAEVTKSQAEAVAALLKALESYRNAAVQLGSMLAVVTTNSKGRNVAVVTLSPVQLIALEKNPRLLKSPEQLLKSLEDIERRDAVPVSAGIKGELGP